MIAAYLCLDGDDVARRFLDAFADEHNGGPYRRHFSGEQQLAFATVRSGYVATLGAKDPPRVHMRLAVVRPGVEPMDAARRLGYTATNVLYAASAGRHLDWIRANRSGMNKECIVVSGGEPVAGFANALLINERERRARPFFENLARHSVSLFLGRQLRKPEEAPETTEEEQRRIDSHTD